MKALLNRSAWVVLVAIAAGTLHSIAAPVRIDRDTSGGPTVIDLSASESAGEESAGEETAADSSSTTDDASDATAGVVDPEAEPSTSNTLVLEADVPLEIAARAYDAGVPFVDARTAEEYEAGHIEGAYLLSPSMFDGGIPLAVDLLDPTAPVIVYCIGGACTDSDAVVIALESLGFESLHVFKAGYPAWVEAGLPTEQGPGPLGDLEGSDGW